MKRKNADRSRVSKDCDSAAAIGRNRFIEFTRCAIECLPITFPAQQDVLEVSP